MSTQVDTDIDTALNSVSEEEYGSYYREHVMDIYRTYLEMADRISARREKANSFFLTLNTAVIGFIGYLVGTDKLGSEVQWLSLIAIAGVVLSYLWYRIILSYRGLNAAKFKVIHEIERKLPIKPFDAEWEAVGHGKDSKKYIPFTYIETIVPWIFLVLYTIVISYILPWKEVYQVLVKAA